MSSTDARPAAAGLVALGRWLPRWRVDGWRLPLLVFVWAQVVFGLWWAGQRPAMLSYDSLRYVQNVTLGPWTASHSPLYDSMILISLTLTGGIAALVVVQTTVAALALAYVATSMRQFDVRTRWLLAPVLILPLSPACGTFVSTLWKDVPFTFAQIFLLGTLVRLLAARRGLEPGPGIPHRLFWAIGVELALIALFRNNGFLVVIIVGAVLVAVLAGSRAMLALATGSALAAILVAQLVVYPAAGILAPPSNLAYGVFYADIAVAYARAPQTFSSSDLALMATVAPLQHWADSHDCSTSDPLFTRGFSSAKIDLVKGRFAALWFRQLARTPGIVISTKLCRSSIAWDVWPGARNSTRFLGYPAAIQDDLFGRVSYIPADVAQQLRPDPVTAGLGSFAAHARSSAGNPFWQTLFFRGSLWSYVSYQAVAIAYRRLRRDLVIVASICAANQLVVMAANPAQLFRYMAAPLFVGLLSVSLIGVARPEPAAIPGDQVSAEQTSG